MMVFAHGIAVKKQYGQHFLRDHAVVKSIVNGVSLTQESSVLEIGCGDGFLTTAILQKNIARLWGFEIDSEWVQYLRNTIKNERFTLLEQNFLDYDLSLLAPYAPWILLANLPYQITFPILYRIHQYRDFFSEGIIMVQEEVAQKIVKTEKRDYGYTSLFFQHFFDWKLLHKIPPCAFVPPPKIFSRLLYFKPKKNYVEIPQEQLFWQFIKACFKQPRRTLRNNLSQTHYDIKKISDDYLNKRAQQMHMSEFCLLWNVLIKNI